MPFLDDKGVGLMTDDDGGGGSVSPRTPNDWELATGRQVLEAAAKASGYAVAQKASLDELEFAADKERREAEAARNALVDEYRQFVGLNIEKPPAIESYGSAADDPQAYLDDPEPVDFGEIPAAQFEQIVTAAKSGDLTSLQAGMKPDEVYATAKRLTQSEEEEPDGIS